MEDADFARFIERVKQKTNIDLSLYKETQMKRRLTTLRTKHGFGTFAEYWEALLREERLINVSEFWRNANRWAALEERFLPEMLREGHRLRIWSAACSTGEEPYTIAMILDRHGALARADILATDIDANVLEKAKAGIYHERSLKEVPPAYRGAYFTASEDGWKVSDRLIRAVRFRRHNLLHDPFDSDFDLIICRNVMIYFTEEAKNELYHKFAKALRPGGLLFVGSTEQIFTPSRYGLESTETFFYRRKQENA